MLVLLVFIMGILGGGWGYLMSIIFHEAFCYHGPIIPERHLALPAGNTLYNSLNQYQRWMNVGRD